MGLEFWCGVAIGVLAGVTIMACWPERRREERAMEDEMHHDERRRLFKEFEQTQREYREALGELVQRLERVREGGP